MTVAPATHGRVLVAMLFVVNMFNYLDRQAPIILLEAIKVDLALTDAQLGILTGFAFAFVYATLAYPLAVLADRWSPKWVLGLCMMVWCSLTSLAAFAQSFIQLGAARMGVAAGEAAGIPCSHSLISASLPPDQRGRAISLISLGMPIGGMTGLMLGGYLNDLGNWRLALLLIGAPGVLFSLLFMRIIRDPTRAAHRETPPAVLEGAGRLLAHPTLRQMAIALTVQGVGQYSVYAFSAAFLIRSHDMTATQAGFGLGIANGVSGIAGLLLSGWLTDHFSRRGPRAALLVPTIAFVAMAPLMIAAFLVRDATLAIILLGVINIGAVSYVPPVFATAQRLAPPQLRAQAASLMMIGVSLLGGSVGPFFVGVLSDALTPSQGSDALRYALCLAAIPMVWGAIHMALASESARRLPAPALA